MPSVEWRRSAVRRRREAIMITIMIRIRIRRRIAGAYDALRVAGFGSEK